MFRGHGIEWGGGGTVLRGTVLRGTVLRGKRCLGGHGIEGVIEGVTVLRGWH